MKPTLTKQQRLAIMAKVDRDVAENKAIEKHNIQTKLNALRMQRLKDSIRAGASRFGKGINRFSQFAQSRIAQARRQRPQRRVMPSRPRRYMNGSEATSNLHFDLQRNMAGGRAVMSSSNSYARNIGRMHSENLRARMNSARSMNLSLRDYARDPFGTKRKRRF